MKVAKLVYFSLMTRVIVDEDATDEEIIKACYPNIQAKLNNHELGENLEDIEDDEEAPFGTFAFDGPCPVCNRTNVSHDVEPGTDILACDDCGSEWVGNEITLDARDELSDEEIKSRGWNSL